MKQPHGRMSTEWFFHQILKNGGVVGLGVGVGAGGVGRGLVGGGVGMVVWVVVGWGWVGWWCGVWGD